MRLLPAVILCAVAAPVAASPVTVHVVEVAGGTAYLDAGRRAGVVRGTKVRFGNVELIVTDSTEGSAAVELGTRQLSVGAVGTAEVTPGAAAAGEKLAPPRPASAFDQQWPAPVFPADAQEAVAVPLGAGRPAGRGHVTVIGRGFGAADRSGIDGHLEGRVIASYDVTSDRPLAVDADVTARLYRAGANGQTRVPVLIRTAQVRYGDAYDPRFALGRLRYAASSVGMLDGARAAIRRGTWQIGAFGGLVPDPLSGKPDTGASRFGLDVAYDARSSPWQPRASITAYGSTWDGSIDERRVTVSGSANRAGWWLDGWAEAQSFAGDNPWNAHAVELTGAGATAEWRRHGTHVGADVTFLRPERSLRLAAALPPEWLCTRRPQAGDGLNEACTGGDSWGSASLSAGTRGKHWSVDAIGAVGRTNSVATTYDSSGYISGELRFGPQRVLAGVSGGRASFGSWMAGELGLGMVWRRGLDVAARYRPELVDYIASTKAGLLHSIVVDGAYAMSSDLDLAVSVVGATGVDRDAVAALATVIWRPLP